jgi:arylsulfatase A-like enzyme
MSVCSPTRISIMTGQNAARHRTTNWINPDNDNAGPQAPPDWNWKGFKKGDVTLPGLLSRRNGYRTIHVGKGHFAPRAFDAADPIEDRLRHQCRRRLHRRAGQLLRQAKL